LYAPEIPHLEPRTPNPEPANPENLENPENLAMTLDALRRLCLSFPGATEQIQWGADLVFKVGGKMFCVACTDPSAPNAVAMSFKCDDETFGELIERDGLLPAPYLARAKWVALQRFDSLSSRELEPLLRRSYDLVAAKLPKTTREALSRGKKPKR
jgi:predicted DNA-binding protein (MmcQ/YjbR family)